MILNQNEKTEFASSVKKRIKQTKDLPPLPEVAHELLRLRNNPNASVNDLVKVVSKDPSLSVKVVRYAQAALFGFGDRITSINQAITVVMGYDTALHMTLGIATGSFLRTPVNGPVGRRAVWQYSLQTAALAQELATHLPSDLRPSPGLCYLSGLLHDFGLLIFGHWYPQQYAKLNNLIEASPDGDIRDLELFAFGISHDTIGSHLLRTWDMPEEVSIAAGEHHFPDYDGKHANIVKLVALANRLINNTGMKDNAAHLQTASLMDALNISENHAISALTKISGHEKELIEMADQLSV
jgi:HD-like signal output (HDOD) protein